MENEMLLESMKSCSLYNVHSARTTNIKVGELPHEWLIYSLDTSTSFIIPKDVCSNNCIDIMFKIRHNTRCEHMFNVINDMVIMFLAHIFRHGLKELPERLELDYKKTT